MYTLLTNVTSIAIIGLGFIFVLLVLLSALLWLILGIANRIKLLNEFVHFVRYRDIIKKIDKMDKFEAKKSDKLVSN